MTEHTDNLEPPAVAEQPTWKPRHRVDPMRPANPHTADDWQPPDMSDYPDPHHVGQHRGGRNLNLTAGIIVAVVVLLMAFLLAWLIVANFGAGR